MYWFTADTHFHHKRILELCKRPFKDIDHMDEVLIANWNNRVHPNDIVFHLGDFGFFRYKPDWKELLARLNGTKIILKGNHDDQVLTCIKSIHLHLAGKDLLLVHRPEDTSYGFDLCLVGHVHSNWRFQTLDFDKLGKWDACNVGVDVWNWKPISIQEILHKYGKWKYETKKFEK